MIVEENGVWTVPLSATHTPYSFVRLKRRFANLPNFTVVIVDTERFMKFFENDSGFVIPPAITWGEERLAIHRDKLSPDNLPVEMPIAHLSTRNVTRPRFFGLGKRLEILTVVSFTNGRHRARYLQFAGAPAMPVEVDKADEATMVKHCGWRE